MSRLHEIFIAATKAEFYVDFTLPEFQVKAMGTMAKAERLYSHAQTLFNEVVERNRSHPTLEFNMDRLQDKLRGQQSRIIRAEKTFLRRQHRIEKVMNRQMGGIRQEQAKEINRVQEKQALDARVFQHLSGQTLSQVVNRAARPSRNQIFNRAADRSR